MITILWDPGILGDPGAVSRVDKMSVVKVYCKIEIRALVSILQLLGSLSTRDFEPRTASGSALFPLINRLGTITFTLLSTFSPLGMISIKMRETPLSCHCHYYCYYYCYYYYYANSDSDSDSDSDFDSDSDSVLYSDSYHSHSRAQLGGSWGARDTPFCKPFLNQTTYNRWRKCYDDILAIVTLW